MLTKKDLERLRKLLIEAQAILDVDVEEQPVQEPEDELSAGRVVELELDEEYKEFYLDNMSVKELKELAKLVDLTLTTKSKSEITQEIWNWYSSLLEEGEDEDSDAESGDEDTAEDDEEVSEDDLILAQLDLMEIGDIKALLKEADLSTKGKKEALMQRLFDAVKEGTIELEFDNEVEENDPVEDDEPAEDDEDAVVGDAEVEAEVEKDIREKIKKGKLKTPAIKKFLSGYFEGDPNCSDCSGCKEADIVNCYIEIQKSMVDDEGNIVPMKEPYTRGGEDYCCGKPIAELDGKLFCEVCGSEYEGE